MPDNIDVLGLSLLLLRFYLLFDDKWVFVDLLAQRLFDGIKI